MQFIEPSSLERVYLSLFSISFSLFLFSFSLIFTKGINDHHEGTVQETLHEVHVI